MREDTAQGNSGDRTLYSNRWTVREALLKSILGKWSDFQELWNRILKGKVYLEIRGQIIRVETYMQSLIFFLGYNCEF